MKVYKFDLTKAQLSKIKNDLKSKHVSTIHLPHKKLKDTGSHTMHLDVENQKKIVELLKAGKNIVLTITPREYVVVGGVLQQKKIVGGFIPIILAGIGAVSGIIGAVAAAATAYKNWKHLNTEETETERHNRAMEKVAKKAKTVTIGAALRKKSSNR